MRVQISAEKFTAEKISDSNRKTNKNSNEDADGYRARQSTKGEKIYEKSEKGGQESSVETGREHSVEVGDRVKRSHDGERESRVDGREIPIDTLVTSKVKQSFEIKESYSLRDVRERSIESLERAKRSHEGNDSHSYKDGRERLDSRERSIEAVDKAKRHHEGNDSQSLKDSTERSIDIVDWASRSHEGKYSPECV